MDNSAINRAISSVKEILPKTLKTCLWLVRITVLVTLGVLFLEYFDILPWISKLLNPLFNMLGLPGEASLAYVTGYFVNVYSAIAVMATLNLDIRTVTILSVMILASHNMITETAVQKKTGSSAIRIVIIRTLSAIALGFILNIIMPGGGKLAVIEAQATDLTLIEMLQVWFFKTIKLIALMTILIFTLSIMQRLLSEFGVIRWLSKFMRPVMAFFGLPAKTSFLWIVANTLGLAYGAAVMIDETESGKITKTDVDLLNHHIAISHSNLEDVLLLASVGAMIPWMVLSRWAFSFLLVWELRLEMAIRKKFPTFVG
ncbi:MAG: nucleoside recognition protein [Bacteroidetes bacterium HGW-Bacteroidetes-10]|nr:MAG: nucleoside recognition protein [Bacteroidetes bacterium HGW-Bacteroidetes-10]